MKIVNVYKEQNGDKGHAYEVQFEAELYHSEINPKISFFKNPETNEICLNFLEGELILQDNYEIHSVSACRDNDGDPEVFIHILDTDTMDTHSVRLYQFPQLDWLLQIVKAVNDKCELTFEIDEDED